MSYKISKTRDPERIEMKYFGTVSAEEYKDALIEFVKFQREHDIVLVLTDLTEMVVTPSILNVYDAINMFEQLGIDKRTSEALIIPENKFAVENVKFYENACQNRGFNVRLFTDREKALKWLASNE